MELQDYFKKHDKAAIALSGGVDSSFLLSSALKYGCDVRPYFAKTAFQPEFEMRDAQKLASQLGVRLTVIEADILSADEVRSNPPDRCYYCKNIIFGALIRQAAKDGYDTVFDGTNASDDADDRPGMRALKELNVLSPLRECGLTKTDIRRLSAEAGLFTHDKPSYACLATRIPSGTPVSHELLSRIEKAESGLFDLGFSDFRVRVFHNAARIQLPLSSWHMTEEQRAAVLACVGRYFGTVMLDLLPR